MTEYVRENHAYITTTCDRVGKRKSCLYKTTTFDRLRNRKSRRSFSVIIFIETKRQIVMKQKYGERERERERRTQTRTETHRPMPYQA